MLGFAKERLVLLILAFVAGFIDTATFVGADGLFSAHITGNFVVFASQLFSEHDSGVYVKLLTFPFFALGVLFVGFFKKKNKLSLSSALCIIGLLIGISSLGQLLLPADYDLVVIPLVLVTAMGIQNAAHKIFLKGTPTSTVMTGNTTQFFLDLISPARSPIFNSTIEMIMAFFCGCGAGAFMTIQLGLSSVVFPGILSLFAAYLIYKHRQN